ncbi:acyl-CoA thioesterase [Mobilicoccus caccae]|uniref:acyl-CoA thioesterase n=1 Tax=Mobilicoccus caccae TaxID=1859295 RepID=UPI0032AF9FA5
MNLTLPPEDFDPLADLLDVLDLTPHAVDADVYEGRSQPQAHGRVYGGQVVAQSVVAAGRTVGELDGPPRHLHSLHGYFLRPGDPAQSIRYEVERLRDGSSFSARRVHAIQSDRPILSMIFSFQTDSDGIDHQTFMPAVPDPETLRSDAEDLATLGHPVGDYIARTRPIDLRHCQGHLYAHPRRQTASEQSVWLRADGTIPTDDALIHAAVLAYASDYNLLEGALRRHGLAWSDRRIRAASLDHAMWFHRPTRADEWVLYTQASPSSQGGRALGLGHMFSEDGTLVATVAQEGMLRLKQ